MIETTSESAPATLEAGEGRPYRFSLVLGKGRGRLLSWLGGKWALGVGAAMVAISGFMGGLVGSFADREEVRPEVYFLSSAALGALLAAVLLRPRTYLFERREGTWCWRSRWDPVRGWTAITEKDPLRLERQILPTEEGFVLYSGTNRLLSYLGDPTIGRSLGQTLRLAGVPVETVMKRRPPTEE